MTSTYLCGFVVIATLLLMPEKNFSQPSSRLDNFEVIQNLFEQVADRVLSQLALAPGSQILLPPVDDPPSPAHWLRASAVKRALERGCSVFAKDTTSSEQSHLKIINQMLVGEVGYSLIRGGGLFGESTLRRHVVVAVDVEVTEQPWAKVWLHDVFRAEFADTLRASEIDRLENPRFPFTRGRVPQQSGWAKLLEPALLTLAAGAAIYALYSLRSQ